jgi:hypothetical protein
MRNLFLLFLFLFIFAFEANAQKASVSSVYIDGRCINKLDILVNNNTGSSLVGMDARISVKTKGGTTVYSQVDFVKFSYDNNNKLQNGDVLTITHYLKKSDCYGYTNGTFWSYYSVYVEVVQAYSYYSK